MDKNTSPSSLCLNPRLWHCWPLVLPQSSPASAAAYPLTGPDAGDGLHLSSPGMGGSMSDFPVCVQNTQISIRDASTNVEDAPTSIEDAPTSIEDALTSVEATLTSIEDALTSVEATLTNVEGALTSVEDALTSVEDALTSVEDALTNKQEMMVYTSRISKNTQFTHLQAEVVKRRQAD